MKHATSLIRHPNSKARLVRALLGLAIVAVGLYQAFPQPANAPAKLTYDSFRTVSDRNIFNPNRYARGSGRPQPRTTAVPASRVESFSLVGIMAYERGVFAFFDGTRSEYKQALQADGALGEYQVISVSPDEVKLATGTNTFALKVGMQMRREDEGDWFLSEGGEAPRKRIVSTRSRTRGSPPEESSSEAGSGEMTSGEEPEVIVIEADPQTEANGGATQPTNGNGNGEPPRAEAEPDNGGVTDPVLLRLMQRRQQMNQ
jgi:hypothetical protein